MAALHINGPIFIRSADNPNYALSVVYPAAAGSAVVFAQVGSDDWNTPLSQWVIEPVTDGVYQVWLFASQGNLLLTASAATATSPIQVAVPAPTDPALELQLWNLTLEGASQYITSPGAPGTEMGFTGDTPLVTMPLVLTTLHEGHDHGDQFQLAAAR